MNLSECKRELRGIVQELWDIEWGIRHDFAGIGQDLCGNCVKKIADKYQSVSRELDKVDYNIIASLICSDE